MSWGEVSFIAILVVCQMTGLTRGRIIRGIRPCPAHLRCQTQIPPFWQRIPAHILLSENPCVAFRRYAGETSVDISYSGLCAPQQILWPGHRNVIRPSGGIGVKSM